MCLEFTFRHPTTGRNVENTESELYLDGIAMAAIEGIPHIDIFRCAVNWQSGSQFNAAIWATVHLYDLVDLYYDKHPTRR